MLTWTCAALVLGQPLSVKPSRVIAGQEPEKTNEFLQAIARAVQKKVFTFVRTFSGAFIFTERQHNSAMQALY